MPEKLKLVTVLIPFLYGGNWRERGEVLEVEAGRADTLAKKTPPLVIFGEHELPAEESDAVEAPVEAPGTPTFTPPGFPCGDELAEAGITNCDQLGELMKAKGDAWFTGIKGIGKKSAALIAEAMVTANEAT
jgi:hypothetical protein